MSNTSNKKKRPLARRIFRGIVFFLVFIIVSVNLFILISGRTYLYKGLQETYLKGKSGPSIYDSIVFPNRKATKSETKSNWRKNINKTSLTNKEIKDLEKIGTTSFLVIKDQEIIHESYWEKHNSSTKSNTFSAAKSFIGLLVGIAIDKGFIKSFDDPITKHLDFRLLNDSNVTIRHLLAMSSGLNWSESGSNPLSDNAEAYYGSDLREKMSKVSFDGSRGEGFVYKSGNSQLLGIILESATGMPATEFLEKHLWQKINAQSDLYWSLDSENGMEKSFCCIYATTHDFARIGQLILNEGMWNDQEVIKKSTLQTLINPSSQKDSHYGLHFWRYEDPDHTAVYARGILGQYIIVIPSLNTVVVRTGHERLDKFKIPENKVDDDEYVSKNQHKVLHPLDLFQYISITKRIVKEK
ncbi:MAG: serine hydrolase [Brumimicrobium sp.]